MSWTLLDLSLNFRDSKSWPVLLHINPYSLFPRYSEAISDAKATAVNAFL